MVFDKKTDLIQELFDDCQEVLRWNNPSSNALLRILQKSKNTSAKVDKLLAWQNDDVLKNKFVEMFRSRIQRGIDKKASQVLDLESAVLLYLITRLDVSEAVRCIEFLVSDDALDDLWLTFGVAKDVLRLPHAKTHDWIRKSRNVPQVHLVPVPNESNAWSKVKL